MRTLKPATFAIAAGALVLFFQNCAQQNALSDAASGASEQVVVKARLDDAEATPIIDPFEVRDEKALALEFKNFRLELESGLISRLSAPSAAIDRLTDAEHDELRSLFLGSVVVRGDVLDPKPDQVCVLVYQEPYALLVTEAASYDMGSGSKCAPLDLYKVDSKARAGLQQFLARLASRL